MWWSLFLSKITCPKFATLLKKISPSCFCKFEDISSGSYSIEPWRSLYTDRTHVNSCFFKFHHFRPTYHYSPVNSRKPMVLLFLGRVERIVILKWVKNHSVIVLSTLPKQIFPCSKSKYSNFEYVQSQQYRQQNQGNNVVLVNIFPIFL